MAKKGWSRSFEDPILLPDGRKLITLKDAADLIMALPKAEQKHEKWQVAIEVLIMAAEGRGPLMRTFAGQAPGRSIDVSGTAGDRRR